MFSNILSKTKDLFCCTTASKSKIEGVDNLHSKDTQKRVLVKQMLIFWWLNFEQCYKINWLITPIESFLSQSEYWHITVELARAGHKWLCANCVFTIRCHAFPLLRAQVEAHTNAAASHLQTIEIGYRLLRRLPVERHQHCGQRVSTSERLTCPASSSRNSWHPRATCCQPSE